MAEPCYWCAGKKFLPSGIMCKVCGGSGEKPVLNTIELRGVQEPLSRLEKRVAAVAGSDPPTVLASSAPPKRKPNDGQRWCCAETRDLGETTFCMKPPLHEGLHGDGAVEWADGVAASHPGPSCDAPAFLELRAIFAAARESENDPEPDPCCGNCHQAVEIDLGEEWDPGDFCTLCLGRIAARARDVVGLVDEAYALAHRAGVETIRRGQQLVELQTKLADVEFQLRSKTYELDMADGQIGRLKQLAEGFKAELAAIEACYPKLTDAQREELKVARQKTLDAILLQFPK